MTSKNLNIAKISTPKSMTEAAAQLEKLELNKVDVVNWSDYPVKPEVAFQIGHDDDAFYIHFQVQNEEVKAITTEINGEVYEDSCCEFFFAPDDNGYYNLEMNAIGTFLFGYGPGRDRERIDAAKLNGIKIFSSLGNSPVEETEKVTAYTLTARLPFDAFVKHPGFKLDKEQYKGNFFKCGDKTPKMHFVTWNPIGTEQPDYHRPEFFGDLTIG
ncbi:carbohydrate-binding family 9-like protein [Prolixibacteraceae bacterium]|nr:carbohydrate-binding family 9-like protein [Prolixibacteraceae bacterium]